jgi:hypothetical protein
MQGVFKHVDGGLELSPYGSLPKSIHINPRVVLRSEGINNPLPPIP